MFEKMSMPQLTLHIGQLLYKYKKDGVCPAHLCIWKGKLEIHFVGHTNIQHPSFLKFTHETLRKGFSANEWNTIAKSIFNYVRRNEPCQKQSAPSRKMKQSHC